MTSTDEVTTKDDVIKFIINYIIDNSSLDNINVSTHSNFITEHLLDSFATLSMIMTLESEYSFKFDPEELGNERMRVVGELAEIIISKIE